MALFVSNCKLSALLLKLMKTGMQKEIEKKTKGIFNLIHTPHSSGSSIRSIDGWERYHAVVGTLFYFISFHFIFSLFDSRVSRSFSIHMVSVTVPFHLASNCVTARLVLCHLVSSFVGINVVVGR